MRQMSYFIYKLTGAVQYGARGKILSLKESVYRLFPSGTDCMERTPWQPIKNRENTFP